MSRPWSQAEGRGADLHVSLGEDGRYAAQHEALRASAALLVEAMDDVVDSMREQAEREGHEPEDEIEAVYVEAREYHVQRIARILLDGALREWAARRPQ